MVADFLQEIVPSGYEFLKNRQPTPGTWAQYIMNDCTEKTGLSASGGAYTGPLLAIALFQCNRKWICTKCFKFRNCVGRITIQGKMDHMLAESVGAS